MYFGCFIVVSILNSNWMDESTGWMWKWAKLIRCEPISLCTWKYIYCFYCAILVADQNWSSQYGNTTFMYYIPVFMYQNKNSIARSRSIRKRARKRLCYKNVYFPVNNGHIVQNQMLFGVQFSSCSALSCIFWLLITFLSIQLNIPTTIWNK